MDRNLIPWIRTGIVSAAIVTLAVSVKGCTEKLGSNFSVIRYDGFIQKCEIAGGTYFRGLCLAPGNFVEIDLDPDPEATP